MQDLKIKKMEQELGMDVSREPVAPSAIYPSDIEDYQLFPEC